MTSRALCLISIVLCLATLWGCIGFGMITDNLSPEEERKLQHIRVIEPEDLGNFSYQTLKQVTGLSCTQYWTGALPTRSKAVRQTKIYAMRVGGNAITHLACVVTRGQDLKNNCNGSIECFADAILVD